MLHIKDIYLSGRSMKVRNGERTHFWGDTWCGPTPLKDQFPLLFNICNEIDVTVAEADARGWIFTYRRWLSADLIIQETKLREKMSNIVLVPEDDIHVWDWNKNGLFSVKSVYKDISSAGIDRSFKHLWKAKIPLKIKVWLWLIWHNAIASKDIMLERGWMGSPKCQLCDQNESIHHLFFSCPAAKFVWSCVAKSIGAQNRPGNFSQFFWWFPQFVPASRNVQILGIASICWAVWKLRNRACFDKKLINSPFDLICYSTVFMKYWAGLNSLADQEMIRRGADNLLAIAAGARPPNRGEALRIDGGGNSQTDRGDDADGDMQDNSNNRRA
jgi:hypothetical protein